MVKQVYRKKKNQEQFRSERNEILTGNPDYK